MAKAVKGPLLFGVHAPVANTETHVAWHGRTWDAEIADRGPTWEARYCGEVVGRAYATRGAAKTGLENHVRRVAKQARAAMGLA